MRWLINFIYIYIENTIFLSLKASGCLIISFLVKTRLKKYIEDFFYLYYCMLRETFFKFLAENYGFIFNLFLINLGRGGLIFSLENLIKDIYLLVTPTFVNWIVILLVCFNLHSSESCFIYGVEVNLEIYTYICNILDLYIGFIFILSLSYKLTTNKKFKVDNPLLYIVFISISVIVLLMFAFLFFFFINKLLFILTNNLIKLVTDSILKMMGIRSGGSNLQPGGFGQPVGGGGKPPKKPGGPVPPKGHYNEASSEFDEESSEFNEESSEFNEDSETEKNEERKRKNRESFKAWHDKLDPIKKEIYLAKKRKRYERDSKDEEKSNKKRERMINWRNEKLANETAEERRARLDKFKEYNKVYDYKLAPEKKSLRNQKRSEQYFAKKVTETPEEKRVRLEKSLASKNKQLQSETPEKREARIEKKNAWQKSKLQSETPEQRQARLDKQREYYKKRKAKKDDKNNK